MKFNFFFFLFVIFFLSGCRNQPASILIEIEQENREGIVGNIDIEENIDTEASDSNKVDNNNEEVKIEKKEVVEKVIEEKKTEIIEVPSVLELKVPFAQQAPFSNWNEITQETCEEASMIMAYKYFNNQPLDDSIMDEELKKHLAWQEERGYKVDLTAEETAFILRNYFNLNAELSFQVEINRIKAELAKGNLIIVPAAGRLLKNPNFKQPGPIYHMLVIKGYNNKEFITNDPGTRNGNSFKYPYDRLINAVHDWDHDLAKNGMTDEKIIKGQKVMIIVSK